MYAYIRNLIHRLHRCRIKKLFSHATSIPVIDPIYKLYCPYRVHIVHSRAFSLSAVVYIRRNSGKVTHSKINDGNDKRVGAWFFESRSIFVKSLFFFFCLFFFLSFFLYLYARSAFCNSNNLNICIAGDEELTKKKEGKRETRKKEKESAGKKW